MRMFPAVVNAACVYVMAGSGWPLGARPVIHRAQPDSRAGLGERRPGRLGSAPVGCRPADALPLRHLGPPHRPRRPMPALPIEPVAITDLVQEVVNTHSSS